MTELTNKEIVELWNSGIVLGAKKEQERIIKLLEESACCQDECSFHEELKNMIALIKGENK